MQFCDPAFLHPPKTGGSSIITALVQSNIFTLNDTTIEDFLLYHSHKTFKEFNLPADHSYAVSVRSPYTRFVSLYLQFYWFQQNKHLEFSKYSDANISRFKRYLLNNLYRSDIVRSSPCTFWIKDITGPIQIIRFENLIDDVKSVYGIDLNFFPRVERKGLGTNFKNNTEKENLKTILSFYDDVTIDIINNFASSDFEHFGYTKFKNYQEMVDYVQG